ncbi:hypothetical protein R3D73_003774 [Serratia marcescens]|nr:hypothetical protein [Serratia marcescens]ELQ9440587.1 hypothetical protein [Serratia marcescens]ELT5562027.1 hypothetical protein [Serratia marcescens]
MNIISKIIESGSYNTKTEQENEQALSLAAKGLINIAIGGIGKTNLDNTNQKVIPVITCSGTIKLRAVISQITQDNGANPPGTPPNNPNQPRLIGAKLVDSHQALTCAK